MKILILSRDDDKKFTKWAETDTLQGLHKLASFLQKDLIAKIL